MKPKENVALAQFTTLRTGGPARYFFSVTNVDEMRGAVDFARAPQRRQNRSLAPSKTSVGAQNLPLFVLGGGSNVIISDDGFDGVVIKNDIKGIAYEEEMELVRVTVGAGEDWDGFVANTVARGLHGLENLSLIPGTVGAAPVQNIGAYGSEVSETIDYVEVCDMETGEIKKILKEECAFAYRNSVFKTKEGKRCIITHVSFLLSKDTPLDIEYKDVQEYFREHGIEEPSLQEVRDAVVHIRTAKLPDVHAVGTAGSFFKNPIVENREKDRLLKGYPEIVWYEAGEGKAKLSAAWLIDHIGGWKGKKRGDVWVHGRQALVLVNYGKNNAQEIFSFAQEIQKDIKEKTGIDLEFEVNLIGEFL